MLIFGRRSEVREPCNGVERSVHVSSDEQGSNAGVNKGLAETQVAALSDSSGAEFGLPRHVVNRLNGAAEFELAESSSTADEVIDSVEYSQRSLKELAHCSSRPLQVPKRENGLDLSGRYDWEEELSAAE